MYYLWKTRRISKPSDYWNMNIGDKVMLKAFVIQEQDERHKDINDLKDKEVAIFPVTII